MSESLNKNLPPEVETLLVRLRKAIRRYVLFDTVAILLCVAGAIFWFTFGLDWVHFQLRFLELPVGLRAFILWASILVIPLMGVWLLLPMIRQLRLRALALVLERRFPELDDRLITVVESATERFEGDAPMTRAMLDRTMREVEQVAGKLRVQDVLEQRSLRRKLFLALAVVLSVTALGIANSQAMARWKAAYIDLDDEYWARTTRFELHVVSQPGDRVREFDDDNVYKHPRGSDLTVVATVPDGEGTDFVVPDTVTLQYRNSDGTTDRAIMARVDDRTFQYTIGALLKNVDCYVRGGDYTNREPYRVHVVDAPRIDQLMLECDYPDYTGLDPVTTASGSQRDEVPVQGTFVSVPVGTEFMLAAATNKKLVGVRIESDDFELLLGTEPPQFTVFSPDGERRTIVELPDALYDDWLAENDTSFRVPFRLMPADATEADASDFDRGIPIAPETLLRFYLHDGDDVISQEPARLSLGGIVDEPPVIETELRGIGTSITRQAVIPVTGRVTDDYGVETVRFDYRVDAETEWHPRPLRSSIPRSVPEFELKRSENEPYERFDAVPLDLQVGQSLTLSVYAEDGNTLNGPNTRHGERYTFKIVTSEELLSILYGKELNLRRRFEQIIQESQRTLTDLREHRDIAEQLATGNVEESKVSQQQTAVGVAAERSLHQIRKNANEMAAIEGSFGEILDELVNNAIHTSQMVERIEGLIVKPMHEIVTGDYPAIDRSLGRYRLAHEKNQDVRPPLDASIDEVSAMIRKMRRILSEMKDLIEYQEMVNELKTLFDDQQELHELTEEESKRRLIEGLKALGLE